MTWQDPMDDTQQTETRRRIKNILEALIKELKSRGLTVTREDENTLIVNGMTFTATDQLSDTYNDVCYLLTDYNQMIDTTLSRISECADTIEELLDVQVEKMSFKKMLCRQRAKNIKKSDGITNMREILDRFYSAYDAIVSLERIPSEFNEELYDEYIDKGDEMISNHDPIVEAFNDARSRDYGFPDILTSDREVASFYMAVNNIDPSTLKS